MGRLVDQLNRTFEERKAKNSSYSLRAFARSLEMDSSSVSAILRGKRAISPKIAQKLIDALGIVDPMEAQTLVMDTITEHEVTDESLRYQELGMDTAETIASWQYFAILALLELHDFSGNEPEISRRLNVPLTLVVESLNRLEKLELIRKKGKRWMLTGKNLATSAPVANQALREGHRQHIQKAVQSLDKDANDLRDISGITMAICRSRLPQAKKLIQDFRRRMSAFLEEGNKNSVYRLNVQLFPLTEETMENTSTQETK